MSPEEISILRELLDSYEIYAGNIAGAGRSLLSEDVDLIDRVKALLPLESTCPNCEHLVKLHQGERCRVDHGLCGCKITEPAMEQVRALIASKLIPGGWYPGDSPPESCNSSCGAAGKWGATGKMPAGHFMYHVPNGKSSYLAHYTIPVIS